jgi:hypothetical protein
LQLLATLNTESLPTELRSYLILLLELLTESPIRRGDKLVPYEEIVKQLDADTISSGTRLGLESRSRFSCGPFSNTVCVMLQVAIVGNRIIFFFSNKSHFDEYFRLSPESTKLE